MADEQLYTLVQKMKDIETMDVSPDAEIDSAEEAPAAQALDIPIADINNRVTDITATGEGLFKEYEAFAQQTSPDDIGALAGTGDEGSSSVD